MPTLTYADAYDTVRCSFPLMNIPGSAMQSARLRSMLPMAVLVVASTALFGFFSRDPFTALALALFFCLAIALVAFENLGLFILLALRPMMDIVGDRSIVLFDRFSINIAAATGVLAIGWCVLVLVEKKTLLFNKPLFWPLLALLGIGAASLLWTQSLSSTVYELVRIASIIGMYLVTCALITTQKQFTRFAHTLLLSLIVPVALGLYQIATHTGYSFFDLSNRVYGTFGHPNVFGFYLVLMIAVLGSYALIPWKNREKGIMIAGFLLLAVLLALTYTRGAWLGMLVVLVVVGLARKPKVVLAASVFSVFIVLSAPIVNRWTFDISGVDLSKLPVVSRLTQNSNDETNSIDWRFGVWHDMLPMFRARPILGYGLGTFPDVRELQVNDYYASTEAHNDFLRLAVETGIVGLAVYVLLLLLVAHALIRTYHALAGSSYQLVVLAMLGFLAGFVVMSFFDNLLQGTPVMWAMWASIAAVLNLPMWAHAERVPKPDA